MPKLSNEPGLVYRDMFVYPNNSIYRGQMKKKDDHYRRMMQEEGSGSNPRQSWNNTGAEGEEDNIPEYRHGYGIQYWTDGAHYEGQWYLNKAEG